MERKEHSVLFVFALKKCMKNVQFFMQVSDDIDNYVCGAFGTMQRRNLFYNRPQVSYNKLCEPASRLDWQTAKKDPR
jgi:hypothetical protein